MIPTNAPVVAAQTAVTLRALSTKVASQEDELVILRAKVASYERVERMRGLAKEMEDAGLSPGLTFEEKVASLSRYPDLDQVAASIKLAGGGRFDLAQVSNDPHINAKNDAAEAFLQFCATGVSAS